MSVAADVSDMDSHSRRLNRRALFIMWVLFCFVRAYEIGHNRIYSCEDPECGPGILYIPPIKEPLIGLAVGLVTGSLWMIALEWWYPLDDVGNRPDAGGGAQQPDGPPCR